MPVLILCNVSKEIGSSNRFFGLLLPNPWEQIKPVRLGSLIGEMCVTYQKIHVLLYEFDALGKELTSKKYVDIVGPADKDGFVQTET